MVTRCIPPRSSNRLPPAQTGDFGAVSASSNLFQTWRLSIVSQAFLAAITLLATLATVSGRYCHAQPPGEPITKIAAGTLIESDSHTAHWKTCLLIAEPRVADGDVDAVSRTVKRYAELWKFVIVARTEPVESTSSDPENDTLRYQLDDVGVGLAMARGGDLIVCSGQAEAEGNGTSTNGTGTNGTEESARKTRPPRLGLIEQQLLNAAEKSLDQMRVVARRTTLVLFDSPGVVHHDGENRAMIVRTLVWVSPSTGKTASAVWLLQESDDGTLGTVDDHGVALPAGFREDRRLHVDADELVLGIPTPSAFALAQLPPGKRFAIDDDLAIAASRNRYTDSQIERLASLLNAAIRAGRK